MTSVGSVNIYITLTFEVKVNPKKLKQKQINFKQKV